MSHPKSQKPRPLGSVQNISTSPSNPIKYHPSNNSNKEKFCEAILGSSMTVPPHFELVKYSSSRASSNDRHKSDVSQPSKSSLGKVISHDSCKKKIQEGLNREKDMKNQTELLSRQLEELKVVLCSKEEENKLFHEQLEQKEKEHLANLNEEKSSHEITRVFLSEAKEKMAEAHKQIEMSTEEHRKDIMKLKEESEMLLKEKMAEKDVVIADRDQKLARLKLQMADALKGNSWERQQQLDELTKELSHKQEEIDLMRIKLKTVSRNKQEQCPNCEENNMKIPKLQATIKEKDSLIDELKTLCSKFETQLSAQDKLLEQWALSKGHKISAGKWKSK